MPMIDIDPAIPQIKDILNGGEAPVSEPLGQYLQDTLDVLELSPEAAAGLLRIELSELMDVINNVAPMTPRLAYKLDAAGIEHSADEWMLMQAQYDLFKCYDNDDYDAIRAAAKGMFPAEFFTSTGAEDWEDAEDGENGKPMPLEHIQAALQQMNLRVLAGKPERLQMLWRAFISMVDEEGRGRVYGTASIRALCDEAGCGKKAILALSKELQDLKLLSRMTPSENGCIEYEIPLSLLADYYKSGDIIID